MTETPADTIAVRKLRELNRATVPDVISLVASFIEGTETAHQAEPPPDWYAAMQTAVGHGPPFHGSGGDPGSAFTVLHHVVNAQGFYQTNVSESWKELTAQQLGVDPDSPEVYQQWQRDVTNGTQIPADMLEGMGDSRASWAFAWWSPDERMALPSSSSAQQGDTDFFTISHVVSLAPEWYSQGLVRISIEVTRPAETVRPDSYDGMTSPLWVQHPADQPATTGGGALETLNASDLTLADLVGDGDTPTCQAYILTPDLSASLVASPSVNVYSVDLSQVSADPVLGAEQASIVEEVDAARAEADAAFGPPQPIGPEIEALIEQIEGVGTIGDVTEAPATDWKAAMERAGREGLVAHRGHRFPYEKFQEQIDASPEDAPVIVSAAAELIEESDDPGVLNLVASLQPRARHETYYRALLDRLEGSGEVPSAAGLRSGSLKSDLLGRLRAKYVATHPELGPRAHEVLRAEGRHDLRLAMLNHSDPTGERLDVLQSAVDAHGDDLDRNLLATTGAVLLAEAPEDLDRAATHVARLDEEHRRAFHSQIQGSESADSVARTLDLDDGQ